MKLMEKKDVVLFWVYLQPFCSTWLLKITFLSILVSRATKNTLALVAWGVLIRCRSRTRIWTQTLFHSVNVFRLENELVNDINDKNVFVNHIVTNIICPSDVRTSTLVVKHFINDFVNTKVNKKSKHRKLSTKWMKSIESIESIENKSVEPLFATLLRLISSKQRTFCSTGGGGAP